MKVLLTWPATADQVQCIRKHQTGEVEFVVTPQRPYLGRYECDPKDMLEMSQDVDVIMGWAYIPVQALESAKKLKLIVYHHVGCDQLDFSVLRARGIKLCNVAGANKVAVAEQGMAFVLALAKRLIPNHQAVLEARWQPWWEEGYDSIELDGKTMVILGLGNNGGEVAKRAKAFGMRILAVDPTPRYPELAEAVFPLEELLKVLPQGDFVMLTLPLTSKTYKFFSEPQLRAMKKTAFLINISRGAIVHEGPLARALTEGWIAGFASDLWWEYPEAMPSSYHFSVPSRLGIQHMPNVVTGGDRAANILAVRDREIEYAAESVAAFARGEVPPRLFNLQREY
jgi:phosphoglycerate dehydrogenase-like enzyme